MIGLRSLAFQILFYGTTAATALVCLPLLACPRRWTVSMVHGWCRTTMWLLARIVGLSWEIRGREHIPPGPVIYAVKHQSAWEALAISLVVDDPAVVLKRELTLIPFFGWYIVKVGMIRIDRRAGPAALARMLVHSRRAVAAGRPVVMFPEGTRVAPGAAPVYQPGIAALYRDLDAPVVPVALNAGLFWARRAFVKRPGRVTVRFLPPIAPGLPRRAFMATLEQRIEPATAALIDEAVRRYGVPSPSPAAPASRPHGDNGDQTVPSP